MSPLLEKDDRVGEEERWAVVRKIGDGGFAEVYEVRDTLNNNAKVWVLYPLVLQCTAMRCCHHHPLDC